MDMGREKENFYRLNSLLYDCILPELRRFFIQSWNREFPDNLWSDSEDNPKTLIEKIKGAKRDALLRERILNGDVENWDLTCVFKALSGLNLDESIKKGIEKLKGVRNKMAHPSSGKSSDDEKDDIFKQVCDVYDELEWPNGCLEETEHNILTTEYVKELKAKLEEEKKAALKQHQKNFCKLPSEVSNFVGREEQLQVCSRMLDFESEKEFLIITGGPCYGKSTLAVQIGYEMYDKGYNYVIWINMRDITRNPISPSLEDIALVILQEFKIDTSEMEDEVVDCLRRKLDMIVNDSKSALLIFDNADNLIQPERDRSCQSSAFEKLCRLIRDTEKNVIRCIFTSRVCKSLLDDKHHKLELGTLSDADSRSFLVRELQALPFQFSDTMITDFVGIGHGLPYALRLICSEAVEMDCEEMLTDFVNELKERPIDALDDESRMTNLFDLSYQRLNAAERALFTSMAVFPSAFSYEYLSMVLKNLEGMNNYKSTVLNKLKKHSLVGFDSGLYMIHPFLREFLKTKCWDFESRKQYEIAYYKTYINQLFDLARESLETDKFPECIQEFRREKQNFLHVVTEIGKGSIKCPSYLRDEVKELLERPTPEYITLVIFYYHELYSVSMIEFLKGCETFVLGQMKKNIWCCRFYVTFKSLEKEIDDDYGDVEPDEYGKAVVEKMRLSKLTLNKYHRRAEFEEAISSLEKYRAGVESLNDSKMKAYFACKILKLKVRLSKRVFNVKGIKVDKDKLIMDLEEALDICKSNFGLHGLTIDCHIQLGKLFWLLGNRDKALASFDDAVNMANSLAISQNNRYISCLIEKGRFLIESNSKDAVLEGRRLVEDTLREWKEVCSEFMWLLGMQSLVRVNRAKCDEVINKFLKEKRLIRLLLRAMDSAFVVQLEHSNDEVNEENFYQEEQLMVKELRQVTDHLEDICNSSKDNDRRLLEDATLYTYLWNMKIATKCMHVLSERDAKQLASKALNIMKSHSFIRPDRREELLLIMNCDHQRYVLMKNECCMKQRRKRIQAKKVTRERSQNLDARL